MSNLSRIAMLAKIRSDLMDDMTVIEHREAELTVAGNSGASDARDALQHLSASAIALEPIILAQEPVDDRDIITLMLCIAAATDEQCHANETPGDAARVGELAGLIELAAIRVAVGLAQSAPPSNAYDARTVETFAARLGRMTASTGGERF